MITKNYTILMKNSLAEVNNRLDSTKQKVRKCEDRSIEIIQSEEQNKKILTKCTTSIYMMN